MQAGAALLTDKEDFAPETDTQAASVSLRYEFLKAATAQQTVSQNLKEILDLSANSMLAMINTVEDYADRVGGQIAAINLKKPESAEPKVANEYNGDASLLCDPIRATIVIPADNVELTRAALALHESTCAVKDLIESPSKTGLAILNAKVRLKNDLVAEIQFVTPNMRKAMQETHGNYKKIDGLMASFANQALPLEVASEIKHLKASCQDCHATASYLDGLDRYVDKKSVKAHVSPA